MNDIPKIPRHIAIIMDGNGRWAQKQGHDRLFGHQKGVESVRNTIDHCARIGVECLTLYVFSAENWGRPRQEVDGLMKLFCQSIENEMDDLVKNGVRVRVIGEREDLSKDVSDHLADIETGTEMGDRLTLLLAFNYGARDEIARAARKIADAVSNGQYSAREVDCKKVSENLYTADYPDPDLVIRTGGECRLSNFLLWQSAYSELYFTDTYWPDFDAAELDKAIAEYGRRNRRFGKI